MPELTIGRPMTSWRSTKAASIPTNLNCNELRCLVSTLQRAIADNEKQLADKSEILQWASNRLKEDRSIKESRQSDKKRLSAHIYHMRESVKSAWGAWQEIFTAEQAAGEHYRKVRKANDAEIKRRGLTEGDGDYCRLTEQIHTANATWRHYRYDDNTYDNAQQTWRNLQDSLDELKDQQTDMECRIVELDDIISQDIADINILKDEISKLEQLRNALLLLQLLNRYRLGQRERHPQSQLLSELQTILTMLDVDYEASDARLTYDGNWNIFLGQGKGHGHIVVSQFGDVTYRRMPTVQSREYGYNRQISAGARGTLSLLRCFANCEETSRMAIA